MISAEDGRRLADGYTKHVFCGRDSQSHASCRRNIGPCSGSRSETGQNRRNMSTLSIRDLDLKGKRVFMRVDFNVPLAPGGKEITSDKRIKASLPTIQYALDHGAGVILASHLAGPRANPIRR